MQCQLDKKIPKTSKGKPYRIRKRRTARVAAFRVTAIWHHPIIITDTRQMAHYGLECVKKAVKYLREIFRHRIGKTRVISLNSHTGRVDY